MNNTIILVAFQVVLLKLVRTLFENVSKTSQTLLIDIKYKHLQMFRIIKHLITLVQVFTYMVKVVYESHNIQLKTQCTLQHV